MDVPWTPMCSPDSIDLLAHADHIPSPIFIIQGLDVVYINPAGRESLNIDLPLPFGYLPFVHQSRQGAVLDTLDKVLANHSTKHIPNLKLLNAGGFERHGDILLYPSHYRGQPAVLGFGKENTETIAHLAQLSFTEVLLNESQREAHIGTLTYEVNTGKLWWSDEMRRICGDEADDGCTLEIFFKKVDPTDRELLKMRFDEVVQTGAPAQVHFKLGLNRQIRHCKASLRLLFHGATLHVTVQDITEHIHMGETLRKQESLTSEILNAFPIEIVLYNPDGSYRYVNEMAMRIRPERRGALGKNDVQLAAIQGLPTEKAQDKLDRILRVVKDRENMNWVEQTSEGPSSGYFLKGLYPVVEGKQVLWVVGSCLNLSKEKEAEESLRFRADFENLLITISNSFINTSGSYINQAVDTALGKIGEFVGIDRAYVFVYDQPRKHMSNTHEWCRKGVQPYKDELQSLPIKTYPWWYKKMQEGQILVIHDTERLPDTALQERREFLRQGIKSMLAAPLYLNNRLVGFLGLDAVENHQTWHKDIADLMGLAGQIVSSALERKAAIDALNLSEEKFRTLTERAHAAVFISMDSQIVYANPEAVRMTGYTQIEMLTRNLVMMLHPDEQPSAQDALKKIFANPNFNSRNERRLITKSGEIRHIDIVSNKINYNNGEAMISIAFDVSEKHKKDRERINLIEKLTLQNHDLEQFSYITSHNLRSPVAGIKGLVSIIDHHMLGNEHNKMVVNKIEVAAQRLDNVIRDLNEVVAVKKQVGQVRNSVFLPQLLQEIIDSHADMIERTQTVISADFGEVDTLTTVGSYLQSILTNLITNGIKYRQPDKNPQLAVWTVREGGFVALHVRDNGTGIDLEKHGERLFQFKQRFHLQIEGNGLGLYLVKTQAELLGGSVSVQSEVGKGSCFTVQLPVTEAE